MMMIRAALLALVVVVVVLLAVVVVVLLAVGVVLLAVTLVAAAVAVEVVRAAVLGWIRDTIPLWLTLAVSNTLPLQQRQRRADLRSDHTTEEDGTQRWGLTLLERL